MGEDDANQEVQLPAAAVGNQPPDVGLDDASNRSKTSSKSSFAAKRPPPAPPKNMSIRASPKDISASRDNSPAKRSSVGSAGGSPRKRLEAVIQQEAPPPQHQPASMDVDLLGGLTAPAATGEPAPPPPAPSQPAAEIDLLGTPQNIAVSHAETLAQPPPPAPAPVVQNGTMNLLDITPTPSPPTQLPFIQPATDGCDLSSLASTPKVSPVLNPSPPTQAPVAPIQEESNTPAPPTPPPALDPGTKSPTPPSAPLPPPVEPLAPHTIVEAHNLASTKALNGRRGRIRRQQKDTDKMATFDQETGKLVERYFVTFAGEDGGKDETYLLGRKNLTQIYDNETPNAANSTGTPSLSIDNEAVKKKAEEAKQALGQAGSWFSAAFTDMKKKVDETVTDAKQQYAERQTSGVADKEDSGGDQEGGQQTASGLFAGVGDSLQKTAGNMMSDLREIREDLAKQQGNGSRRPSNDNSKSILDDAVGSTTAAPASSLLERKWSDAVEKTAGTPAASPAKVPSGPDDAESEMQDRGNAIRDSLRAVNQEEGGLGGLAGKAANFIDEVVPLYLSTGEKLRKTKIEKEELMDEGMKMSKRVHVFEQKAREAVANSKDLMTKDQQSQEKLADLRQKLQSAEKKITAFPKLREELKKAREQSELSKKEHAKSSYLFIS